MLASVLLAYILLLSTSIFQLEKKLRSYIQSETFQVVTYGQTPCMSVSVLLRALMITLSYIFIHGFLEGTLFEVLIFLVDPL